MIMAKKDGPNDSNNYDDDNMIMTMLNIISL